MTRKETKIMTDNVSRARIAELKAGIIGSAITDYVWTFVIRERYLREHEGKLTEKQEKYVNLLERDIESAERFFKSDWFEELAYGVFDRYWLLEKMDMIRKSENIKVYTIFLNRVTLKIANSYKS